MSYPTHLITINKHFYYRISIPVDLRHYFPAPIIQKSLKTTSIKEAKPLLLATEYMVQKVFAQLRTGMLDHAMAVKLSQEIVSSNVKLDDSSGMAGKQKAPVKSVTLLSAIIKRYVADKQVDWTAKTKMEVKSVFNLLQDMLGDVDVCSLTKPQVVELRANLMKLPANVYKKHPGKTIQQVLALNLADTMSLKSVNKHVARLGAVLRYCVDEGLIATNPASGLKISEKKRADEERSPYDTADIERIVKSLPHDQSKPERYQVPLSIAISLPSRPSSNR